MNGLIVIFTLLFDDFDYTVALYVAEVALAGEAPEVGACRCVVGSGIPEVFFFRDVLFVEDAFAPAVVDGQRVVGIAKAFEQVADDELVVVAVAVGCHGAGELQEVVDQQDAVLDGVAAFDDVAAGSQVLGHSDKAHHIVARNVAAVGLPLECRVDIPKRVVGDFVVAVVLDFPVVLVLVRLRNGQVVERHLGVHHGGVHRLPRELCHGA